MQEYGGSGQGDFKLTVGLYRENLQSAFDRNSIWMVNTSTYRKFFYDSNQREEEERELKEEHDQKEEQRKIQEDLLKKKQEEEESKLTESVLEMLRVFDR